MVSRFTAACDTGGLTTNGESCYGPCIEMVLPVDGTYGFVRGCLPVLMGQYYTTNANSSTSSHSCTFQQTDTKVNVTSQDTGLLVTINGYAAFRQCSDSAGTLPCNNGITSTIMNQTDPTATLTQTVGLLCSAPVNNVPCIACSQSNHDGLPCSRHTTTTCLSSYCSHFEGALGGNQLVTRGCAPFNPYMATGCVWLSQNPTIPLPYSASNGGRSLRKKRDLGMMLEGHQCYCQGSHCNGAVTLLNGIV